MLLFETFDDHAGKAFWITPGGGIEPGETIEQTARRELAEETGHAGGPEVFGPVAVARGAWEFRGTPLEGEDWFFACPVDALEVEASGWTELERELTRSWRWWHPDELDATDEVVFPAGLADLARALAAGERPASPVALPWSSA